MVNPDSVRGAEYNHHLNICYVLNGSVYIQCVRTVTGCSSNYRVVRVEVTLVKKLVEEAELNIGVYV
jgi:hypothetical protein